MLGTVINCFSIVISSLREISINIGGLHFSLFTLLFGIFIFATLCRTYLKYILDLPTNIRASSHHSISEYINSYGEIYKVVKSRWY